MPKSEELSDLSQEKPFPHVAGVVQESCFQQERYILLMFFDIRISS
ncbi:MAG: hypothetical protein ACTSXH_03985 [Promethearchaeota archaeon]